MHPTRFAFWSGLVLFIVGVLSFVPALSPGTDSLPVLYVEDSYGLFLGLFAMNVFNKVALIFFGLLGMVASSDVTNTSLPKSIFYSRLVFFTMGALAILGMFQQTNTFFGYMPLYGYNIWFNAAFAVLGGYFGYALTARLHQRHKAHHIGTSL